MLGNLWILACFQRETDKWKINQKDANRDRETEKNSEREKKRDYFRGNKNQ